MKKIFNIILVLFLLFFVFFLGVNIGDKQAREKMMPLIGGEVVNKDKLPSHLSDNIDFNLFWEVWDAIQKNYVDRPVPETQLFYGALAGQVASLGDPYSVFLDPDTAQKFSQELSSEFEGIGAEIGIKKGILTVISPLPDSPAEHAGLQAGDKIYKIDGKESAYLTLNEAVSLIRGKAGTEVILTVLREGVDEEIEIKIIRDRIHFNTVKWEMKPNDILYIKISHFNNDTEQLFNEAVRKNFTKNIRGIILDLRNNPGGFLDTAVNITGKWVRKGETVVIEKFSEKNKSYYRSKGRAELSNIPTVILVNKGSASASEILAGALQDYGLATLVGEPTFGKGSVQDLLDLSNGSKIKITVAKWLTPKERVIENTGIAPDVFVELTGEDFNNDKDPQLDKAIEILNKTQD